MEAIGQLTGGIAHDFNNVLQAVSGNLELIRRRVRDDRPDVARGALPATWSDLSHRILYRCDKPDLSRLFRRPVPRAALR
jgi:signal transduction histidine kinase